MENITPFGRGTQSTVKEGSTRGSGNLLRRIRKRKLKKPENVANL